MIDLTDSNIAYIFGLFQTDGHLSANTRNRGRLSLEINIKDQNIIHDIAKILPVTYTIKYRTRTTNFKKSNKSIILNIFDLSFRQELILLGLPIGNKSKIIKPPTTQYSEKDYWRGIIDGDGSLGFCKSGKYIVPFISLITTSKNLYLAYKKFVFKIINHIVNINPNKRDNAYNIILKSEDAQKMINYLYSNSNIFIKRKQDIAKEIIKWKRPKEMIKK